MRTRRHAWLLAAGLPVGFVFVFLSVWGIGAPFFRAHHSESVRRFPQVA
ncbi:MAG: hypothetical protein ABSH05_11485 [Bryobacteraceae bacterium]|jgi:hypothetical protein